MPPDLPIALAIPDARRALARMYIELSLAFRASIQSPRQKPKEPDANLTLTAVAVLFGHADGHPMTASQIARLLQMPPTSVLTRLTTLVKRGVIRRIKGRYYLEPVRAREVPHVDTFNLILSQAFDVLGPILSELDK